MERNEVQSRKRICKAKYDLALMMSDLSARYDLSWDEMCTLLIEHTSSILNANVGAAITEVDKLRTERKRLLDKLK